MAVTTTHTVEIRTIEFDDDDLLTISLALQRWRDDARKTANGERLDGTCLELNMQDCARHVVRKLDRLVDSVNHHLYG